MLGKLVWTLFSAAMFAGSVYFLCNVWSDSTTFKNMDQWPQVIGEVTKLEVWVDESKDKQTKRVVSTRYYVEIEYDYSVDGERFTGDRDSHWDAGQRWDTQSEMNDDLSRHVSHGDQAVSVAYHPDDPAISIAVVSERSLEGKSTSENWTLIGLGVIMSGYMGMFFLGNVGQFFEGGQTSSEREYFEKLDAATGE